MTVPAINVDVVNLALLQLYQGGITTLSDLTNPVAIAANAMVDQCRRSLLKNYNWVFARKRGVCPHVANKAPAFDYTDFYQLPNDFVKLLWIGFDWERYDPKDYDFEQGYIAFNGQNSQGTLVTTSLNILYIADITDVTQWSPLFIDVVALDLARRLCMPVTGDKDLKDRLEKSFREMLAEARAIDHMERPVRVTERERIMEGRVMANELLDDLPPTSNDITVIIP